MTVGSVQIPNTTRPNIDGTPNPSPIAADDTSGTNAGPFIQQFSPSTWMRWVLGLLAPFGTAFDPLGGRLRVFIDPLGGAQTLGAVTTVSTVSNITSVGGFAAQSVVFDLASQAWALSIRARIT